MKTLSPTTRREFLQRSFAFSAAAALAGCGTGINPVKAVQDPVSGGTAHFLMVGDWGEDGGTAQQSAVAFAMQEYAKKYTLDTDALLMLGDNMYGSLRGGALSPRFINQFELMYPESVFNCPALCIPGNHDYQVLPVSKFQAEVQYAQSNETRWTMPGGSYIRSFPTTGPALATLIMLDSNMPNEKAQPLPPDPSYYTMDDQSRIDQLAFLQATLAVQRTTPWLFVVGHHPLYSNGIHGDNATLIRDWDPLFRQYGVDLYLAGHDHDLQHIELSGHPTSFVCSGGGGAPLYPLPHLKNPMGPFAKESYGFTHLQVKPDQFIVRHLDTNGNLLHKFTKLLDGTITYQK